MRTPGDVHGLAGPETSRAARWIKVQALVAIAYSGARTAEAVTLEWDDIRWDQGVAEIPVDRHKTRRTGRIRRFPILPRLMKLLAIIRRWPHHHPKYVFLCSWNNKPSVKEWWRWLREDLRPWLMSEGLVIPKNWRPYWLRPCVWDRCSRKRSAALKNGSVGNGALEGECSRQVYFHTSAKTVSKVGQAVAEVWKKES